MSVTGCLRKMRTELASPVRYYLPLDDNEIALNPLIGQSLTLSFNGEIYCTNCSRKTKKSFSQGYCYPCMQRLAACDLCIVRPEICHFTQGTCREPQWGLAHCMLPHVVYLANSSGLKVGITRQTQVPTRWIDQGAVQALPILHVSSRIQSGLLEHILKQHVADKTNWRAMLKGDAEQLDLAAERERLLALVSAELDQVQQRYIDADIAVLQGDEVTIAYPITQYPEKIVSHNLDKKPTLSGTLLGIKGQYLIFDTAVINIRKYAGYKVKVQ